MSTGKPARRVVNAVDENGKSYVAEDGPTPAFRSVAERPGYHVSNIWITGQAPSYVHAPDGIEAHQGVSPPKGGTVLRIIEYPPDPADPEELARQIGAMFGNLFDDAHRPEGGHPGMHTTETVDYAIVIEGEITSILDDGSETVLRAGDVLIQCGANHAWSNKSGKPAKVAFVLIDGRFDE